MVSWPVVRLPKIHLPSFSVWYKKTSASPPHGRCNRVKFDIESTETHPRGQGTNGPRANLSRGLANRSSGEDVSGVANGNSTRNPSR